MKKILCGSVFALVATGAMADGFYISPRVAYGITSADESRVEHAAVDGVWSEFDGNKHESWDDKNREFAPQMAVGYDFDMGKAGIFAIEAMYTSVDNFFKLTGTGADEEGNMPNDSDARNVSYDEQTIGLNAKYGYKVYGVVPFVTAGVGYTTIDYTNNFRSGTYWWETTGVEHNMSWNLGAGIEVPVTEKVSLSLAYTYTDLGSVKYSNSMFHNDAKNKREGVERVFKSDVDLDKHEFIAGVKFTF
ncbi:MAG: outer membrane beta-barrel protein [Alphaproteobacteria bacterium]|nr:outer membrane beta-barrel protein [Alphaproteobacteria bacterium]